MVKPGVCIPKTWCNQSNQRLINFSKLLLINRLVRKQSLTFTRNFTERSYNYTINHVAKYLKTKEFCCFMAALWMIYKWYNKGRMDRRVKWDGFVGGVLGKGEGKRKAFLEAREPGFSGPVHAPQREASGLKGYSGSPEGQKIACCNEIVGAIEYAVIHSEVWIISAVWCNSASQVIVFEGELC